MKYVSDPSALWIRGESDNKSTEQPGMLSWSLMIRLSEAIKTVASMRKKLWPNELEKLSKDTFEICNLFQVSWNAETGRETTSA